MTETNEKQIRNRLLYYQSEITQDNLGPGEDYDNLPETFIVFICMKDPFKMGRAVYRMSTFFEPDGESHPEPAGVGVHWIVLNASAWKSCPAQSGATRALLQYLETGEVGDDALTPLIESRVEKVNADAEWRNRMNNLKKDLDRFVRRHSGEWLADGEAKRSADLAALTKILDAEGRDDLVRQMLLDQELQADLLREHGFIS